MGSSNLHGFLMICAISAAFLVLSSAAAFDSSDDRQFLYIPAKSECLGSISECMFSGDAFWLEPEFEMESEISRRILATARYISYGALRRNSVPCSRRGASYYNCRPGAQANPYSRGCSAITRCRR